MFSYESMTKIKIAKITRNVLIAFNPFQNWNFRDIDWSPAFLNSDDFVRSNEIRDELGLFFWPQVRFRVLRSYSGLGLVAIGLGLMKFGSGQTWVKFFSHFSVNVDWIWQKIAILMDGGEVHAKIMCKKGRAVHGNWQIMMLLDFGLLGWTKLYLGLLGFIKKLLESGLVG